MKLSSVIDRAGEMLPAASEPLPTETALIRDGSAGPPRGPAEAARSRRSFLAKTAAVLGGAAATAAVLRPGQARANHLPTAADAQYFGDIRRHEADHVLRLNIILGEFARPKPTFQDLAIPDFPTFLEVSQAFENIGCAAYAGAAPFVLNPEVTSLVGPIALIEARHAGFLNTRRGGRITENVFGAEQSFEMELNSEYVLFLAGRFFANPAITPLKGSRFR